jgi:tRNA dimethylallyltransferase
MELVQRLPYLMLAGPTASGKTAAALALADYLDRQGVSIEIISVDSALVYRHLNIGTAKPGAQELAAVPHHLIDIIEPTQSYSAAQFVRDVQVLIDAIRARSKLPVLVGGTMMYFKSWLDGMDALPPADPKIRAGIDASAMIHGWPALHAELAAIDPGTAQKLAPNDAQRIQRALEVYELTGQPMSQFHLRAQRAKAPLPDGAGRRAPMIALEPVRRAWLHERIAQRFDTMLAHGLMDEVKDLRARGDLSPDLPAMRCVGYRQAWEALDGLWPMHELRARALAATRQLAKRQITWLRAMPGRQVVVCDAGDPMPQLVKILQSLPALEGAGQN